MLTDWKGFCPVLDKSNKNRADWTSPERQSLWGTLCLLWCHDAHKQSPISLHKKAASEGKPDMI